MKASKPKWKEILKTLFLYDEEARVDLFALFPRLKNFFVRRRYFAFIRTLGDILFTILILVGLFGPQDPSQNAMLFLSWGVWWTSVVLSWFFLARMWCAFCPFPGLGRLLQRLGFYRKRLPPRDFSRYCAYIATLLFALIIWIEAVTHMKYWPFGTALLLLFILAGATVFSVLYKGQAWCRHFCPMGKITGSAATMAIIEFRPDHEKCRYCKTFACKRGKDRVPGCPVYLGAYSVRNNLLCFVCGHCLPLCDYDSPRIYLRHPLKELIINKGRFLTCAYIIPFLIASQFARFIQEKTHWYKLLLSKLGHSEALSFSLVLLIFFLICLFIIRLGVHLFTIYEDELFGRFSPMVPVLVPFAFTGELIYRAQYFLENIGDFLPTLGRQLGYNWESFSFVVPESMIKIFSIFVLFLGFLGSIYTAYIFYRYEFEGLIPKVNFLLIILLIFCVMVSYFLII